MLLIQTSSVKVSVGEEQAGYIFVMGKWLNWCKVIILEGHATSSALYPK